jgi:peptidoglycan/xylan/chitin deacetylase (PgdA/CDA1 family)
MNRPTIALLLMAWCLAASPIAAERAVTLTFDDLPLAGPRQGRAQVEMVTSGILEALDKHDAPALGLVTTKNVLFEGQVDFRLDQLRRWLEAGATLGNHSFSHRSFQKVPLEEFQDDFVQGDLVTRMLMAEADLAPLYYRHPYNHTGPTSEAKRAFETFMKHRGYRIIPFTVEHADYMFNKLYVNALVQADVERANRIGEAYLAQLDLAMEFAERLSQETFGREIPQILLLHADEINGRYLESMLRRLAERGYRFVRPEAVLADDAYETPDRYVGPTGISWLHRWRRGMGREDRLMDEPDPPRWVIEAYRELSR